MDTLATLVYPIVYPTIDSGITITFYLSREYFYDEISEEKMVHISALIANEVQYILQTPD